MRALSHSEIHRVWAKIFICCICLKWEKNSDSSDESEREDGGRSGKRRMMEMTVIALGKCA